MGPSDYEGLQGGQQPRGVHVNLPTPHPTPQKSKLPLAEIHLHLDFFLSFFLFFRILQERFYYGLERGKKVKSLSRVQLFVIPWTVAHQAPPSMEFSTKGSGVGCCFLLQGIFLTQGSNPVLPCFRQMLYLLSHQGSNVLVH